MNATDSLVEEVRQKIIAARKKKGLSRPKVALRLGMTASNYRYFENGRSVIGLAYLLQLPDILNCKITDLLPDAVVTDYDRQKAKDKQLSTIIELWPDIKDEEGRELVVKAVERVAKK